MQSARIRDTRPRGCTTKGGTSITWNTGLTTACRTRAGTRGLCGMKMPLRYVVEMYIDRVAASKNYQKERYTDRSALEYYLHGKDFHVMHKDTRALLELLLYRLAVRGEQEVNTFIREELLAGKIPYEQKVLDQLAQPYHREAEK